MAPLIVDSGSVMLVLLALLVMFLLALCPLRLLAGPCCGTSWTVWTSFTVFALVVDPSIDLGKKECSWEMQCQFVQTLVMSRLLFKAHVWTLRHKDTVLLHRPYMRALRRVAGAGWKSNEATPPFTDSEVRRRLGAPSIECLLIKARLQYLGRVCRGRHCFPTLWAILDKKCGSARKGVEVDTPDHPWVQQLRADMRALWALSLPSPQKPGCEKSWLDAAEDEKRWRALVGGLHFKESTIDKKGDESRVKSHPVVSPWTCCECGEHFISEMARDQHARKKHGRRCTL